MAAPPPHLQHAVGSQTEIPVAEKPHPLGCERDAEAFSVHDDVVVSETVAFHEITREHLETPGRRLEALPTPWPLPPWERRARSIPGRARAGTPETDRTGARPRRPPRVRHRREAPSSPRSRSDPGPRPRSRRRAPPAELPISEAVRPGLPGQRPRACERLGRETSMR